MSYVDAIILGIIQGITEFLPISSSGHLVLFEEWLGLNAEGLKDFDVVVHLGTLVAILGYFWKEVWNVRLWPYLIIGTLPAAVVGILWEDQIDAMFRSVFAVSILMMIVGVLFCLPERKSHSNKPLTWWRALGIGLAQAIAILPGVSRSGSTIFSGVQLGLNREEAAKFSFLLGAIAIGGAGLLTALDLRGGTGEALSTSLLLTGFFAALISGLVAVYWLMRFLKKHSLRVFGVYLLFLGGIALTLDIL